MAFRTTASLNAVLSRLSGFSVPTNRTLPIPWRTRFDMFALVVLMLLFAVAPVSTSAINLTWIFLLVFSGWVFLGRRHQLHPSERSAQIGRALAVLMAMFSLGLVLLVAMKLYWSESVRGLSFELTALVSAAVSLAFATGWSAHAQHRKTIGAGIFVASLFALAQGYGYMFTDRPWPTNPVNWGAGMALVTCLALSRVVDEHAADRSPWLAVLSVVLLLLAIFVAGRRGAFFVILWCAVVGSCFFVRGFLLSPGTARRLWLLPACLGVVVVGALLAQDPLAEPLDRVRVAASEVKALAGDASDRAEVLRTSLGSRFHMAELGVQAGSASPWVGVGAEGLADVVRRAESDLQSPLFHLHNEYLQAWVAYGVVGLLASVSFPIGLLVAGFLLRQAAPASALAMTGLGLVHFFNGLSNVNTFHNYYGTVFAVCVALPFLMFAPRPAGERPAIG